MTTPRFRSLSALVGLIAAGALVTATRAPTQQGAPTDLGGAGVVDLTAAVRDFEGVEYGGFLGVAVADGHYFVTSCRARTGDPHRLFELDAAGRCIASYATPTAVDASSLGLRDGTFDPATRTLWFTVDANGAGDGNVVAFDLDRRRFDPARCFDAVVGTPTLRGLAFDGRRFWTASFAYPICAFDPVGREVARLPSASDGVYGLAWSHARGTLWLASQRGAHSGQSQGGARAYGMVLVEIDPTNGSETGRMFRADAWLPAGALAVAGGASIHMRDGREVVAVIAQAGDHDLLVECVLQADESSGSGPRIDYAGGGNPYAGNSGFALVADGLAGAPAALFLIAAGPAAVELPEIFQADVLAAPLATLAVRAEADGVARLPLPLTADVPIVPFAAQVVCVDGAWPAPVSQILHLQIEPRR